MKKVFALALVAAFGSASVAMAATTKVEFKRDSGESQVVSLDGAGTATLGDGTAIPYTYDEATTTMCFQVAADTQNCATFAEHIAEPTVGSTVRYTSSDGAEGTATVLEIAE